MNSVQLIGNIATDLTLSKTQNGKDVVRFLLAVNFRDHADFIPVEAWNNLALNVHQYCQKGSKIAVVGYLHQYNTMEEEKRHLHIRVVAMQVEFLSPHVNDILDDEWSDEAEEWWIIHKFLQRWHITSLLNDSNLIKWW